MNKFGEYLKLQRQKQKLSLKDVYMKSGITDSKLSRVERGEGHGLEPMELKKLAQIYDVNTISLYLLAGYISEDDLKGYRFVFKNANLLTNEEQDNIQTQINLMTKGRKATK